MTEAITSDSVDPSVQIEWLQKRIAYLENLLQSNKIPFEGSVSSQPAQPVLPTTITPRHARFFYSLFRGRQDVFSRRATLKNGNHAYFPVCDNLWVYGICPKKEGRKIKCADCTNRQWTPLTQRALMEHLMGNKTDGSDVIGMYPLFPDDTCRFLVFDFDDHANEQGERWKTDVAALRTICKQNEVPVLVERSRSGNGAHVWLFFEEVIPASLARKFGSTLLTKGANSVNLRDFKTYDRMLPAQEHLPPGGLGNLIALPMQGQSLRQGNSAFVDEHWNAYPDQWELLKSARKISKSFVEQKSEEWSSNGELGILAEAPALEPSEKPWQKRTASFSPEDALSGIKITYADGLYIDTAAVKPRLQNQIRRLAAFRNPEFYKTKAKDREKLRSQLRAALPGESVVLVATGQYIGEGFNYPRLDTLMLTMPISWSGNVEQYAGRLHRDYADKKDVIIYDYVDVHISVLESMYYRRLKTYKQIGYQIIAEPATQKQQINAIFDSDSYLVPFETDLRQAEKSIVIFSPVVSHARVKRFLEIITSRQGSGVLVSVFTLSRESLSPSHAQTAARLQTTLKQAGVLVEPRQGLHGHFAVIDERVIWYGNANLLSRSKEDDSLMRIENRDIALELLETFCKEPPASAEFSTE